MIDSIICALPCIWPILVLVVGFVWVNILKTRMLYKGPLPSDGPIDGFASKADRIEYYDTGPARIRSIYKALWVFGLAGILGTGIIFFITRVIIK